MKAYFSIRPLVLTLLSCIALGTAARAQYPQYPPGVTNFPYASIGNPPAARYGRLMPPPLPARGPAALLYVKFDGPPSLRITLYPSRSVARTEKVPVTVGFRPGYVYRVKVSGFPKHPEAILFPTLEVRGTLAVPPKLKASQYPAPLVFRDDDAGKVEEGTLLTKAVALENPDTALPRASDRNRPLEEETLRGQDPLAEARTRGRPLLIVRMGQREFTPEELAADAIAGTILLPGDRSLSLPAYRPFVPFACFPMVDPLIGPRWPDEECLRDGGDTGTPVGIDRNGRLLGLDPTDTVAEYSDSRGRRRVAVSNRVCICVPRFLVIRGETALSGFAAQIGIGSARSVRGQHAFKTKTGTNNTRASRILGDVQSREKLGGASNTQGPVKLDRVATLQGMRVEMGLGAYLGRRGLDQLTDEQKTNLKKQVELARLLGQPTHLGGVGQVLAGPTAIGRVHGINVVGSVQETRDFTVTCLDGPIVAPPGKPLLLHKWTDRQAAQVGDVITFFIKFTNRGGQAISDVAISDSLTGRLEYIDGSAQSDRDAVFTLETNEAGSKILRWEVGSKLQPGQSGVVKFRARVR